MKTKSLVVAVGLALSSASAFAGPSWVDWTSTSAGTMAIGTSTVGVSMTGSAIGLSNGDGFYNNYATGGTSTTGTYGGLLPSDLIQVNGASTFSLTFTDAILNPYIALVSVGQGALPVTYSFSGLTGPISIVSQGNNMWGFGSGSVSGSNFTGAEWNGVLQLMGSYTSLTFSVNPGEHWHGFNIGSAVTVTPVPEPETYAMMLAGIGLMGLVARRRRLGGFA